MSHNSHNLQYSLNNFLSPSPSLTHALPLSLSPSLIHALPLSLSFSCSHSPFSFTRSLPFPFFLILSLLLFISFSPSQAFPFFLSLEFEIFPVCLPWILFYFANCQGTSITNRSFRFPRFLSISLNIYGMSLITPR